VYKLSRHVETFPFPLTLVRLVGKGTVQIKTDIENLHTSLLKMSNR